MTQFRALLAILLFSVVSVDAQDNTYLTAADSDPQATRILEDMEKRLLKKDAITVDFTIALTYPGEDPVNYSGTVRQQFDMFFIDAGNMQVISDGKSRWVYLVEDKEVNLYDAKTAEGPRTPLEMLQIYKEGDYVYRLSETGEDDGASVQYIEFKPVDKASEFAKIRLTVQEKDQMPVRLELFEKGGARTDLRIHNIEDMTALPDAHYTFDAKDHPGVHIEDLRID